MTDLESASRTGLHDLSHIPDQLIRTPCHCS
jgi:hypothetical protein